VRVRPVKRLKKDVQAMMLLTKSKIHPLGKSVLGFLLKPYMDLGMHAKMDLVLQ
jgi:hypothetical protein